MVTKAIRIIILTFVAGLTVEASASTEWQLVEDSSTVRFIGVQEGSAFRGRFGNFSAMIDFDPAKPTKGKIIGVVKMDSAKTGDAERDATLLDEDWFNPENSNPTASSSWTMEHLQRMDN